MDVVLQVIIIALAVFQFLLIGRIVLELVQMFARDYRPGGFALLLFEAVYTVTDPPVNALRRVIPPLRLGGVALDLSVLILFIAVYVAISLVSGLR
jgi:YggT family protein